MKILVTTFGYYKKGGWGRIFSEAKGLADLGHQVTLLCSLPGLGIKKRFYEDGVKIIAFHDIIPGGLLGGGYGLLSLLSKLFYSLFHSFDICLANHHRDNAYCPCALNRFVHHSKLVTEWWDNIRIKQEKEGLKSDHWLLRFLAKRDIALEICRRKNVDAIVALSSITADRAKELGFSSNKIRIVRGGCDVEHINYQPKPTDVIKEQYGIPNDCLTFGLIGDGDWELDDMCIFLDAMLELASRYKILLLNFGKPFKQTVINNPALKELIKECGWIDYTGDNKVLSATDVFILIKKDSIENRSGWPNKIGDYLACGRPVMLNPYGELIPFIKEWHPGIIEVDYSKDSITKEIISICNGEYDLVQLGIKNHEIACNNSWLHRAKELESLFLELIKE